MKPKLKPPGTKRLKLKYDELHSSFAFKFNLRRYSTATQFKKSTAGFAKQDMPSYAGTASPRLPKHVASPR